MPWYRPMNPQKCADGSFKPSSFTLLMGVDSVTKYKNQYPYPAETYKGTKPILVVCTDTNNLEMANKKLFNTGNHPVEMLVPMLHFRDAGFSFDFATVSGQSVKLEMWAFPGKDKNVKDFHTELLPQMEHPKKLADIASLDGYAAIFLPGGHGCMINLPQNKDLGRLLCLAHDSKMPTVTLCHGPATLLAAAEFQPEEFIYKGYEVMCFTAKTDGMSPSFGYMPGQMPWSHQQALEGKGVKVLNKKETGAVTVSNELISGDSPWASDNLGRTAAPILVQYNNAQ